MHFFSRIFPTKTDTRLLTIGRSSTPQLAGKIRDNMLALLGWRSRTLSIPRAHCHRLTLSLKGVPKRLRASAIRLQLLNISGLQTFGFAWRLQGDEAEIWYWDESTLSADRVNNTEIHDSAVQPSPEMFWRRGLNDGMHLLTCTQGYEALSIENGRIRRTRWFSDIPSDTSWRGFVRDAGKNPENYPLPSTSESERAEKPDASWKIDTTLVRKMPPAIWISIALIMLTGLVVAILLAYDSKQVYLINRQKETLAKLKVENAATLELQKQISENSKLPELISGAHPKVLQLELMQAIADTGLFGEGTNISLLEWEYRNEKLRLLFAVPKDNFSLGLFLSTLEGSHIFQDLRLMPDTPPQTIGIQATVRELSDAVVSNRATEATSEPTGQGAL